MQTCRCERRSHQQHLSKAIYHHLTFFPSSPDEPLFGLSHLLLFPPFLRACLLSSSAAKLKLSCTQPQHGQNPAKMDPKTTDQATPITVMIIILLLPSPSSCHGHGWRRDPALLPNPFSQLCEPSERASCPQQCSPEHTVLQGFRVLESCKKSEYNILFKNMVQLLYTLCLILVSTKKIPNSQTYYIPLYLFNVLELSGD